MKPTIEELEAALSDWCNLVNGGMNDSAFIDKYELFLGAALTQAIEIARGEKVLVPREPDITWVEQVCLKAGVCGGIFESVHNAMITAAQEKIK